MLDGGVACIRATGKQGDDGSLEETMSTRLVFPGFEVNAPWRAVYVFRDLLRSRRLLFFFLVISRHSAHGTKDIQVFSPCIWVRECAAICGTLSIRYAKVCKLAQARLTLIRTAVGGLYRYVTCICITATRRSRVKECKFVRGSGLLSAQVKSTTLESKLSPPCTSLPCTIRNLRYKRRRTHMAPHL